MELNPQQIRRDVLVVGASAGGMEPAFDLIAAIPADVPLIVGLVIHRGAFGGPSVLAQIASKRTGRPVIEPLEEVDATAGVVYLGPRDQHVVFHQGRVMAVRSAKLHFTRPAIDPLFTSAASEYGPRVMGVLLSGGGSDGVLGLIRIKEGGGLSLVQAPAEATHPSMPVVALREDHVDAALPIGALMKVIPALASGHKVKANSQPEAPEAWASVVSARSGNPGRGASR